MRAAAKRALEALGSRPLSVGLMAALALYVAMLLAWTFSSPPTVVESIAAGVPYRVAYGLLAVNTLACVLLFWRSLRVRCRPYRLGMLDPTALEGPPAARLAVSAAPDWLELSRRLRWRGFSVRRTPDGGLHAARGRFSALGTAVFHLSLLVAASGALVEHWFGFSAQALVNEGQSFFGEQREYLGVDAGRMAHAPELSFRVRSIVPAFYRHHLYFTDLVATVEAPVGPEPRVSEVRLSDALAVGNGRVSLVGFGYSLEYLLRRPDGSTADEALANLMIFPPGQRDSLRLPGLPYAVFLELFPDFVVDAQGNPSTRGMALGDVRLGVTVLRNRAVVARRLVKLGEAVELDGLSFVPARLVAQGQFRIRRSPGVPLLGIGFAGMLGGLAWRLLRTRRELLLRPDPAGGLSVCFDGEGGGGEVDPWLLSPTDRQERSA